tara:strand:+ start:81 stop:485 length:405 start_codon:yes stop_codon:yes gene_type:complete
MPNWCENEIRVSGDTKKVKAFMKFVKSKDQDFDFEKVIPLPKGEWDYQWCLDNWDTKWNACDVEREYNPKYGDEVEYTFNTAWSPPENIFRELKNKFKLNEEGSDIFISWFYREDGMEFSGYLQNEERACKRSI